MKDRAQIVDQLIDDLFAAMSPRAKLAIARRITEAAARGLSAAGLLAELAAVYPESTRKAVEMAVAVLREIKDGE